jgi:hypothetical protein
MVNLETSVEDIQENLYALSETEGKDAIATMNHDKRIRDLERMCGLVSQTPEHLRESSET